MKLSLLRVLPIERTFLGKLQWILTKKRRIRKETRRVERVVPTANLKIDLVKKLGPIIRSQTSWRPIMSKVVQESKREAAEEMCWTKKILGPKLLNQSKRASGMLNLRKIKMTWRIKYRRRMRRVTSFTSRMTVLNLRKHKPQFRRMTNRHYVMKKKVRLLPNNCHKMSLMTL